MQRRGVEDDAGVRVERRELRPVGLGQADDRADLRIELGAQPLPDRRAGGEMVVVAADAARPRRLLRHQHRAGGDEAVEDDRVGAGQVDHPAEGAARAPALAEDRRHPAEPGARGAGELRRARSDHADVRADRIDEALARRVDAAERHLQAAADERVGELADEALDAAGQRQAFAEQQHMGRPHRRPGVQGRAVAAQQRGDVDPLVVRRGQRQAALAQGAQPLARAARGVEQAERRQRPRRAAPAAGLDRPARRSSAIRSAHSPIAAAAAAGRPRRASSRPPACRPRGRCAR